MVEVVHCKRCHPPWGRPGDVMIDRHTKWGNPFAMKTEAERDMVCNAYERYFQQMESAGRLNIEELYTAQRLGCWCKPKRCHGDYLKMRIDQALQSHPLSPMIEPPRQKKKLDIKNFGVTSTQKTLKSGSYINDKGDLVKTYERKKKKKSVKVKKKCRCKK